MGKNEDTVFLSKHQVKKSLKKKIIVDKNEEVTIKCFKLRYRELCSDDDSCFHLIYKALSEKALTKKEAGKIAGILETEVDKLLPKAPRNTLTKISTIKLKKQLEKKGVSTLGRFQLAYDQWHGRPANGSQTTIPGKVWKGDEVSHSQAKKIAEFLGVNVESLKPDLRSPWESLIYSQENQVDFMAFHGQDPGELGLAVFDCNDTDEQLERHKIRIKWHLLLDGKKEDHYLIILRSDSEFNVIAPVKYDNHSNINVGEQLRYPQNGKKISFDKREGGGFRELIAIRITGSGAMPYMNERSKKTTHHITLSDLESLANSMLLDQSLTNKIAVSVYPFVLV